MVGRARHRAAQRYWLRHLPRRQSAETQVPQGSQQPDLGQAGQVYRDRSRLAAAGLRLVGRGPPHELFRRLADGSGLVPADPVRQPAAVFLHLLLHHPAGASRAARSRHVRGALWPGLGGVLHASPVSAHSWDLLTMDAALTNVAMIARQPLPTRDRIIIGLIIFFAAIAMTLEGYWLIFNQVM